MPACDRPVQPPSRDAVRGAVCRLPSAVVEVVADLAGAGFSPKASSTRQRYRRGGFVVVHEGCRDRQHVAFEQAALCPGLVRGHRFVLQIQRREECGRQPAPTPAAPAAARRRMPGSPVRRLPRARRIAAGCGARFGVACGCISSSLPRVRSVRRTLRDRQRQGHLQRRGMADFIHQYPAASSSTPAFVRLPALAR